MNAFSLRPDGAASLDGINNPAQGLTNPGGTGGQLSPLMPTHSRDGSLPVNIEADFGTTILNQHPASTMVTIHS